MNAVIIDGSGDDPVMSAAADAAGDLLSEGGYGLTRLRLADMRIVNCCGRFDCWIRTPGECATRDDGREVGRAMIQADLLVVVTPVSFGGYSARVKAAMDRCLPAILPFLQLVNNEVHHPLRGGRPKSLAVIGCLDVRDAATEAIFEKVVRRNSLNMRSPSHSVVFVCRGDSPSTGRMAALDVLTAVGLRCGGGGK